MHKASTEERSLHGQYPYHAPLIFLVLGARHSPLNLKDKFRRLPAINQCCLNPLSQMRGELGVHCVALDERHFFIMCTFQRKK